MQEWRDAWLEAASRTPQHPATPDFGKYAQPTGAVGRPAEIRRRTSYIYPWPMCTGSDFTG
jgi:hypothetical protein